MLTGAVAYPIYLKELKVLLRTNFGVIGKIPVDLVLPEKAPHYDDPCINPRSKIPIAGSRMYPQVPPTQEENDDPGFDDSDLDLNQSSKDLRSLPSSLLNLLYSTQTAAVKEILNSIALTTSLIVQKNIST